MIGPRNLIGPRKFRDIVNTMLEMVLRGDESGAHTFFQAQDLYEVETLAVFRELGVRLA
jgi:hypothetical protein